MKLPKIGKIGRSAACILFVAVLFAVYVGRLLQLQLLEGKTYQQIALSERTDSIVLEAARGQILDSKGNVLAGNKTTYAIVYNALNMIDAERNPTILQVITLLTQQGEKWRDRLPIVIDAEGNYQFKEDSEEEIAALKDPDMLKLADYATADDCMTALMEKFDCSGYSKEDTRIIASVRYSMSRDGFSRTNPYVIAEDVSSETVGIISEKEQALPGIEPKVAVARYYGEDGSLAPHIIGSVGILQQADYNAAEKSGNLYDEQDNLSGYRWTDTHGSGGIEETFEKELRGKRGKESILTDDNGKVQSTTVSTPPEEGSTVHLTLDSELQRVANLSLKENITGNTDAKDCTAGAAVVLNPKTFGVLVSATYPNYDMNRYQQDDKYINQLLKDESEPLYNRALEGVFVPGSVFKPMVALAALQEGTVSAGTTYYCDGAFRFYDMTLGCTGTHGNADMYSGLASSCNAYFCNVGLNLTIAKMDAYAEYFALGTKTGIELPESTGIMSSPLEYQEQHNGAQWTDGLTPQTAIGQCDNMFTPIQLATYCATVANNGVRLQTHLLDKITNYSGEKVLEQFEPTVLSDAGLSSDVLGVVKEGMMQVAYDPLGTAYSVFGDYPVSVACKTGTAETSTDKSTEENLSFIAYAPADDPQIAVAVVLEYGKTGNWAKNVARDIMDQFFGFATFDEDGNRYDTEGNMTDRDGKILKTKEDVDKEKAAKAAAEKANSASQGETGTGEEVSSDTSALGESSSSQANDGIPDAPYTGEGTASFGSAQTSSDGETSSSPVSSKPSSPYWKGD